MSTFDLCPLPFDLLKMNATLRFGLQSRRFGGFVAALALSGCVGRYESDFPVIVVNRTANTIQALANGKGVGTVDAGQTQSFSIKLPESNANVFSNGTAPTPQADVTFTARDTRTGALSSEKGVTLSKDTPTYVAFSADDFPSTVPTVARFTFSPTNPTINQDVSYNASASSVSNGTYVWDFGDGAAGAGVTTTHRYLRGGTFTITLTVTSDAKQTSTSSRTVNVSATLPPQAANLRSRRPRRRSIRTSSSPWVVLLSPDQGVRSLPRASVRVTRGTSAITLPAPAPQLLIGTRGEGRSR